MKLDKLDPIINQPLRLAIMAILVKAESADFNFLQKSTEATKGNLSRQITKLKEEKYIEVKKTFKGNYPNTTCKITPKGIKAFKEYTIAIKNYLNLD